MARGGPGSPDRRGETLFGSASRQGDGGKNDGAPRTRRLSRRLAAGLSAGLAKVGISLRLACLHSCGHLPRSSIGPPLEAPTSDTDESIHDLPPNNNSIDERARSEAINGSGGRKVEAISRPSTSIIISGCLQRDGQWAWQAGPEPARRGREKEGRRLASYCTTLIKLADCRCGRMGRESWGSRGRAPAVQIGSNQKDACRPLLGLGAVGNEMMRDHPWSDSGLARTALDGVGLRAFASWAPVPLWC